MNKDLEKRWLEKQASQPESPSDVTLIERIDHFTWAWFVLPMGTGGIALLLGSQPHTFRGLDTIGKIFFIVDLLIFVTLVGLITIRFIRQPSRLRRSLSNASESLFFPTSLISVSTIINLIWKYGGPSSSFWLVESVRIIFWIYYVAAFTNAVGQYWYLFKGVQFTIQGMTPAWLLPVFPFMLCGTVASDIAEGQPQEHRLSICLGGFMAQGLGFLISLVMYAPWIRRMMQYGLPPPDLRPGMFIAVGPPSFTALALIGIARDLPSGDSYLAQHPGSVEVFQALALAIALFIWILGFWFFCITFVSVIDGAWKMSFHLAWWAFVFPNVGFTIAVISIGQEMMSQGILWVGTAMTLLLIVLYFFVLGAHIRAVWRGDIMWPGKDEDRDE